MKNGESLKTGIAKLILILVSIALTVTTITVGVFAAFDGKKNFMTIGTVSFVTDNIEGEIVGKVTGYGYISGKNFYNGTFLASNQSTTTGENGEIGNALKPWEMGDIHFIKEKGKVSDIEIIITIKNRGDREFTLNFIPPSSADNVTITYKQALTETYEVSDSQWLDVVQASEVGKIVSSDGEGNRVVENLSVKREQFYTFRMIISITNQIDPLDEEGVNLSFKFEITGEK